MVAPFKQLIRGLLAALKPLIESALPKAHPSDLSHSAPLTKSHGSTNTYGESACGEPNEADKSTQAVSCELDAKTIESEIRAARKFSLADAIGKEGGSFLRSGSTIPLPLQATTTISHFVQTHAREPGGAFSTTLQAWSSSDIRLSRQLERPLNALSEVIDSLLCEPTTFYEFARQVAIAQGQLIGSRPYFQQPNQRPHPEADYTHDTIRAELTYLRRQLQTPHH